MASNKMRLAIAALVVAVFAALGGAHVGNAGAAVQNSSTASWATYGLAHARTASAGTASTDCSVCQFVPAVATTTTTTTTTYKEHIHIVKTVKEQIRQYEIKKHVIATINEGGPMSGAGCIDPTRVKRWGFHVGDSFKNTDHYHRYFFDTWKAGWKVCNWHLVKIGGQWYVEGIKANCHNRHILIPVNHRLPKQTKTVIVFRTVKKFRSVYDKWITKNTVTTTTTSTTYSCDSYGSDWTLTTENGTPQCKNCPPTPCKAHATLMKAAFDNGAEVSLSGGEFPFSITVNGTLTSTTTNAASGASRDLGDFNAGDNVKVCETNSGSYTPDQVCISHTMTAGEDFVFSFVNRKSTSPPTYTASFDTINLIPGPGCRPETLHVTTSVAGAIQISPTNGLISTVDCYQPDPGQHSMVTMPVGIGSTDLICYVYESADTTITSDTLTAVPLISGVDAKNNTVTTSFTVTHPKPPSAILVPGTDVLLRGF